MKIYRQKIYSNGVREYIEKRLREQIKGHKDAQKGFYNGYFDYHTTNVIGNYSPEELDKISDENNALVVPNDIDSDYRGRLCHQHVDKNQRIKLTEDVQKYMKRKGKINATEFIYGSDNNTPLANYLHEMGHANNSVGKSNLRRNISRLTENEGDLSSIKFGNRRIGDYSIFGKKLDDVVIGGKKFKDFRLGHFEDNRKDDNKSGIGTIAKRFVGNKLRVVEEENASKYAIKKMKELGCSDEEIEEARKHLSYALDNYKQQAKIGWKRALANTISPTNNNR